MRVGIIVVIGLSSLASSMYVPSGPLVAAIYSDDPTAPAVDLFTRVAFVNEDVGLIGGIGHIERTSDGGRTWRPVTMRLRLRAFAWVSESVCFAATSDGLLRSDDAGITWSRVYDGHELFQLTFIDRFTGFAVAGSVDESSGWASLREAVAGRQLLYTSDGGLTWRRVATPLDIVQSVAIGEPAAVWIAGPSGIAVSSDAGAHWRVQITFPVDAYRTWGGQVFFWDRTHGFALYRTGDTSLSKSGRNVFYTIDGGAHWTSQLVASAQGGADGPLVVLGPASAEQLSAAVAAEYTGIAETEDGGSSWQFRRLPVTFSGTGELVAMGSRRWVAIANGWWSRPRLSVVLSSVDGGVSWLRVR